LRALQGQPSYHSELLKEILIFHFSLVFESPLAAFRPEGVTEGTARQEKKFKEKN